MSSRDLVLKLHLKAPRAALWRGWTEAELLPLWFCPRPWGVSKAVLDVRIGGASEIVIAGPNGEEILNRGVYLDVVPAERLVFTDAFVRAWEPSEKPFFTGIISFADAAGGGTDYTAQALHWNEADRERHETMGFHDGWSIAARQLDELALSLT